MIFISLHLEAVWNHDFLTSFEWYLQPSRCRGSVYENLMYLKCQRKYYNLGVTENTKFYIFSDTCLQWDFHYNISNTPDIECIFRGTWSWSILTGTSSVPRWKHMFVYHLRHTQPPSLPISAAIPGPDACNNYITSCTLRGKWGCGWQCLYCINWWKVSFIAICMVILKFLFLYKI